ncbi:crotonase/enoyl-CoA hydratase family protein [Motiliproteus sp.]|uniref:crotonase/enoyl-CoA hydratase family protein n=1 Tax=Motiliproteus sp. TaxID=1898955 RepID=UPI003BAB6E5C
MSSADNSPVECPSFETLSLSLEDGIATVSLNNPDKANAMSAAMWRELQQCFEWVDSEPGARVAILNGEGKHFCAGIDITAMADFIPRHTKDQQRINEQLRLNIKRLQGNLTAIERCRKPVLAAVQGACIGGGVDMICCADMRYASRDAYFTIKEIDLALTADVGTLQRLPHLIGRGQANELALTGRRCEADEAQQLGLVNRVYDDSAQMLEEVRKLAAGIAAKSPLAIRGTKEMLLYSRDHSVEDGLNYVATWNSAMLHQQEMFKAAMSKAQTPEFED